MAQNCKVGNHDISGTLLCRFWYLHGQVVFCLVVPCSKWKGDFFGFSDLPNRNTFVVFKYYFFLAVARIWLQMAEIACFCLNRLDWWPIKFWGLVHFFCKLKQKVWQIDIKVLFFAIFSFIIIYSKYYPLKYY